MKRFVITTCVFLMSVWCSGVASAENTLNKIVAIVQGEEMITLHDVQSRIATDLARKGKTATPEDMKELAAPTLDAMINDFLLLHEARRLKITVEDTEVEAEVRKLMRRNRMSQKAFEAQLIRQGTSLDLLKEQIRNNTIRQRISAHMIAKKVIVTPEEIEKYYQAHKHQLITPKLAYFSIIVFSPNVRPESVRASLVAGQVSFEEAAHRTSRDPSAKDGGRIPPVAWDSLPESVQNALSALSAEEISPIMAIDGVQVLYKLHSIEPGGRELTLTEATPHIIDILRDPLIQQRYNDYLKQLRSKARIEYRL